MAQWSRSEYVTAIRRLVQEDPDVGQLDTADIYAFLDGAVLTYGRARPLRRAFTQAGNGTTYQWAMPATWYEGWSQVVKVELPTGDQIASLLEGEDWEIFYSGTTTPLTVNFRLLQTTPSSSETLRVEYTAPHILSDATNTIQEPDQQAGAWLAAADMLLALAADAAHRQPMEPAGEIGGSPSAEQEFRRLAKDYRDKYHQHMGYDKDGSPPAGQGFVDWDRRFAWGGDPLFHGRRGR